jgi:hypothetical protein
LSQHAAAKRTFGVVGYWHADPGKPASGPSRGVMWSPISGSRSAWCGLRQHGDITAMDAVTANPFNQDVVQFFQDATGTGSANNFPGYPSQIDQLLFRDIPMTTSQSLIVQFKLPHAHVHIHRHVCGDTHRLVPWRSARRDGRQLHLELGGGYQCPAGFVHGVRGRASE